MSWAYLNVYLALIVLSWFDFNGKTANFSSCHVILKLLETFLHEIEANFNLILLFLLLFLFYDTNVSFSECYLCYCEIVWDAINGCKILIKKITNLQQAMFSQIGAILWVYELNFKPAKLRITFRGVMKKW